MQESFAKYLFYQLLAEDCFTEGDFTPDELSTADDVLSYDELDVSDDDLTTYAHMYREKCTAEGTEPDFTGFEEYE